MRHLILISLVLILSISLANADWFDDLTDKVRVNYYNELILVILIIYLLILIK